MKISDGTFVLTGAASQIGRRLAIALLERGAAKITIIDNLSLATSMPSEWHDERVDLVLADVVRLEQLLLPFSGADGVFHLAGFLTLPLSARPLMGFEVNATGTANVLEAARANGVGKVVLSSSVSVYGNASGSLPEGHPLRLDGLAPPAALYALSKLAAEQFAVNSALHGGPATVALRYATIYGEGQHGRGVNSRAILQAMETVLAGEVAPALGRPSTVRDYVHIDDVVSANIAAMESDASGVSLNIASGRSTSNATVAELITAITGGVVAEGEAAADVAFAAPDTLDYDIGAAQRLIGWVPRVSIEEGLRRLWAWTQEQRAEGALR